MKKNILKYLLLLVFVTFASCKTIQVAKFTSVENLFLIKLNSSLEEVVSILGSKPYNILISQVGGYTIYSYKYKFVERKVNPKLINSIGGETAGTEAYYGKEQTVYLFFKSNKLEAFITSDGRKYSASMIILNNTLQFLTKSTPAINYNAPITFSKEIVSMKTETNIISENEKPPKSDNPKSVVNNRKNDIVVDKSSTEADNKTINSKSEDVQKQEPKSDLRDNSNLKNETTIVNRSQTESDKNTIYNKSDNLKTPEKNPSLTDNVNLKTEQNIVTNNNNTSAESDKNTINNESEVIKQSKIDSKSDADLNISKNVVDKTEPSQATYEKAVNNNNKNAKPKNSNVDVSKRYRIQLGAFVEKPKLTNVPELTTLISDNGLIKYYSGNFKTYEEAKAHKQSLIGKYKDAFIVPFDNHTLFRVQVGAFKNTIKFNKIDDISIQYLENGKSRYFTGNYTSYDEALIKKKELIKKGMVGAFIVEY